MFEVLMVSIEASAMAILDTLPRTLREPDIFAVSILHVFIDNVLTRPPTNDEFVRVELIILILLIL